MRPRFHAPLLALLLALGAAAGADAQELSQIYRDWAAGPVRHLFTDADRTAWGGVASDAAAEDFIRLFWARRDPDPATADNEFQAAFERRTAYADERFAETTKDGNAVRGALTDRGRVFIMLGPPRRLQQPGAAGSAAGGDFGVGGSTVGGGGDVAVGSGPGRFGRGGSADRFGVASEEVWIYEDDRKPEIIKRKRFQVHFRTQPGTEEVELYQGEEALAYAAQAAQVAVVRPELTLADLPATTGSAIAAGGAAGDDFLAFGAEVVDEPATAAALHQALTAGGGGSLAAHLDTGAFQASDGTWIVPLQVSTTAPPPAGARLVGELVDAQGEAKLAFRGEGEWSDSKDQHLVKATLVAPPGAYRVQAGLEGSGGEMLWRAEEAVEVPASSPDFWISEVVLSEHIFPMAHAQQMLEPYAWQGIVVVPKGGRTFAPGDVMWFYVHACNPQLGDDGKPSLRVSVTISGPSSFRGPVSAEPVRAGDHCWVLAQGLDVEPDRFAPGAYEMKLNVRDSVGGKTLVGETGFTVAGASQPSR